MLNKKIYDYIVYTHQTIDLHKKNVLCQNRNSGNVFIRSRDPIKVGRQSGVIVWPVNLIGLQIITRDDNSIVLL